MLAVRAVLSEVTVLLLLSTLSALAYGGVGGGRKDLRGVFGPHFRLSATQDGRLASR
jgi:hypothetical protein